MEFWIKIDTLLRAPMEAPKPFGIFHILMLALVLFGSLFVALSHKKGHPEDVRRFVFWAGIGVILFEIYKQYLYNFSIVDGKLTFHYSWDTFPFQFCYLPLYLDVLFAVTKKGRFHNALAVFLATFFVVAGTAVMLFPSSVFGTYLGMNLQTMLCHGIMIVNGVYLLSSGYVKLEHKSILKALPLFAACVFLATVFNELAFYTGVTENNIFNMFYISRHFGSDYLPIAPLLSTYIPPATIFFIYLFGFPLLAYFVLLIAMGIKGAVGLFKEKLDESGNGEDLKEAR